MFIEVYFVFTCENGPYSNIELTALVEQRLLDVLLDDAWFPSPVDLIYNLIIIIIYCNPSALISCKWFNQPQISPAMLNW